MKSFDGLYYRQNETYKSSKLAQMNNFGICHIYTRISFPRHEELLNEAGVYAEMWHMQKASAEDGLTSPASNHQLSPSKSISRVINEFIFLIVMCADKTLKSEQVVKRRKIHPDFKMQGQKLS